MNIFYAATHRMAVSAAIPWRQLYEAMLKNAIDSYQKNLGIRTLIIIILN